MLRSVLLFPGLATTPAIQAIRQRFDPLAAHIRPHVSLVFPFNSPASDSEVIQAVEQAFATVQPFSVRFDQLGNDGGDYYWLAASTGKNAIVSLHDRLYQMPIFAPYWRQDIAYAPHITLGRGRQPTLDVQTLAGSTLIREVCVEHILANDDSSVFETIQLD
jgi:2'-5' RNA ligase